MLSISTYTIWGGVEVIEGELELPLYVPFRTPLAAVGLRGHQHRGLQRRRGRGDSCAALFESCLRDVKPRQEFCQVLLQMQKVTPSLERLVRYINLSTDLPKRRWAQPKWWSAPRGKDLERHRRVATSRLASETSHEKGPGFVLDKLPIASWSLRSEA